MAMITQIFFIALLITVLHGFPQQNQHQRPESNIQSHKQDNGSPHPHQRQGQGKPLDRSQISTLPAAVNFGKQDNKNNNRRTRDTNEETKPLDRSQISTLPAAIKFEDTKTQSSEENSSKNKNRDTRSTDSDDSSEENSKEKRKPVPSVEKDDSSEEDDRKTRTAEHESTKEEGSSSPKTPQPDDIKIQPYRPSTEPPQRRY